MKHFLIIGILFFACSEKSNNEKLNIVNSQYNGSRIFQEFEKQIIKHINSNIENGDSIRSVIRDTTFIFQGYNDLRVYLSQYHTPRNKYGIVGIDNFNENLPTLLLYDSTAIEYLGDSINIHGDILLIYGRILTLDKEEVLKIGFDLKFDGTKFPWIIE